MLTFTTTTHSADETFQFGQQLGQAVQSGQVIALHGDLGAGKTVLTQGLANALGITARVTSPTFTLVNEYARMDGRWLIHIDCYRFGNLPQDDSALEATFAGVAEMLDRLDAIVIIEWAERIATLLPPDYLQIDLAYTSEKPATRHITCTAHGEKSIALLTRIQDTYR